MNNLALVKPEKANAVENYLIQMARIGQLGGKVRKCTSDIWSDNDTNHNSVFRCCCFCQISDSGLIEILEKVSQQTVKKTTVTVSSAEMLPVIGSLWLICPSYSICALFLSVQQTEGNGLGWWGWLLTFKPWNKPRNRERIYLLEL